MESKLPVLLDSALPGRVKAALGELRGAAWMIDVGRGRIVAATGPGLRRLRLSRDSTHSAVTLDGASPALVRLREIARDWPGRGRDAPRSERLMFWSPAGPLPLLCEISVVMRRAGTAYVTVREHGRKAPRPRVEEPATAPADVRPLLSELAHELRTPLGAIAAAAEIMRDERFGPVGDPRYAGYVAGIHDSACHALRIVERVLTGKPPLPASASSAEASPIDVNATLENVALQVRPLAEDAGLELALDLAADLPHVAADATSLRQIVINLLTNALKFTRAGGRVRVSSGVGRDGTLEIAVEDSGSGMSRAEIARTMDLGHGPTPKRRAGGGLGLGLPLVRALAEANGATLTLESEPGRGTKAKIAFTGNRGRPG